MGGPVSSICHAVILHSTHKGHYFQCSAISLVSSKNPQVIGFSKTTGTAVNEWSKTGRLLSFEVMRSSH